MSQFGPTARGFHILIQYSLLLAFTEGRHDTQYYDSIKQYMIASSQLPE